MKKLNSVKESMITVFLVFTILGILLFTINTSLGIFETKAKAGYNTTKFAIEKSAIENFERVIEFIDDDLLPIKVDDQKLEVSYKLLNGKLIWTVTNRNKFDVVYRWRQVGFGESGVNETVYAEGGSNLGSSKSSFFTTPTNNRGKVVIEWLDENGAWKSMELQEPDF
ncbi:hypothetical protein [Neobacillus niacini]|uniref:hypothetical protein n=1 Tax=Neobacillus niacini TaxID=86668 RepID=UPI003982DE90